MRRARNAPGRSSHPSGKRALAALAAAGALYLGGYLTVRARSHTEWMGVLGSDRAVRVVYLGLDEEASSMILMYRDPNDSPEVKRLRAFNRLFTPARWLDRKVTGVIAINY